MDKIDKGSMPMSEAEIEIEARGDDLRKACAKHGYGIIMATGKPEGQMMLNAEGALAVVRTLMHHLHLYLVWSEESAKQEAKGSSRQP